MSTLQEQVVGQLGRDICSGRWRLGQVLPSEPELCARFGHSRIVIREAVKSLVARGLLAVSRRIGTRVLDPGCWNLFDPQVIAWRAGTAGTDATMARHLMELRRIVEPAAVRLAAERASEADRRSLRAAYMAMARAVAGKGDCVEAHLACHTTLLAASGNQYVRHMQQALGAMLRTGFKIVVHQPGGPARSLPLHGAVCKAVEQGRPQAAERAARLLTAQAEQHMAEVLASRRGQRVDGGVGGVGVPVLIAPGLRYDAPAAHPT